MTPKYVANLLLGYAESHGQYFDLHFCGYAEPGYDDPDSGVIATGNWNENSRWSSELQRSVVIDDIMPRIAEVFEKLGIETEWEDEWGECSECFKLLRTSPNSYGWKPSYWECDGLGIVCEECVTNDPGDYLESLEGNCRNATTFDIDLECHGYKQLDGQYESGLRGGQCDHPEIIAESLRKMGVTRFIFSLDSVGQFDMAFSVWVHEDEFGLLDHKTIESRGDDPAIAMQNALRNASQKMSELDGCGIRVAHCRPDGSADVKVVSPEAFIAGDILSDN